MKRGKARSQARKRRVEATREREEPTPDPWDFGRARNIWLRRVGPWWTFDYRAFAEWYGWIPKKKKGNTA